MRKLLKLSQIDKDKIERDLEKWSDVFKSTFKSFALYCFKNHKTNNCLKCENNIVNLQNIDKDLYNIVVSKVLDDIVLLSCRYNCNGINEHKVIGSFIYHFINERPLIGFSKRCNIALCFKLLALNDVFQYNSKDISELFYFLNNRVTTQENLYFILKNL